MIQPIAKNRLFKDISEQIVDMIKTGSWPEGSRIPTEAELTGLFCVGRNSVREAVKSLQLSGILESSPGLGTFVTPNALQKIRNAELLNLLSNEDCLADLTETRLVLETQLTRLAASRAKPADIAALEKTLNEMRRQPENKEALLEQGYRFHTRIAETTGNRFLIGFYRSIAGQLHGQRDLDFLTLEVYKRDIEDHESILQAIRERDGQKAMILMERHLKKEYARYLQESDNP